MPQSLSRILVHLVFSTSHRKNVLNEEVQSNLYAYLAKILQEEGCCPIEIGGMSDHVHLFFTLSRTITLAKVVEELKSHSSKWLKSNGPSLATFSWQRGYGAFSVGQSDVERVIAYIRNQPEHHKRMDFQEEFRKLLDRYRVEYDERYVWD